MVAHDYPVGSGCWWVLCSSVARRTVAVMTRAFAVQNDPLAPEAVRKSGTLSVAIRGHFRA